MGISATWTDPTTLDLVVNQTLGQSFWENLVSNELWLYDLLTGTLTGQLVSLAGGLKMVGAASNLLDFGAVGVQTPNTGALTSTGVKVNWYDAGTGTPNVYATGVAPGELWDNVPSGQARTYYVAGGRVATVSSASLSHTGTLLGHGSYAAVEGPDGTMRHVEILPPTGSQSVASGGFAQQTLTFSRPFANKPAITAIATITGAAPNIDYSIAGWGGSAGNWTSVAVDYTNHDAASQTISDMCITAIGD